MHRRGPRFMPAGASDDDSDEDGEIDGFAFSSDIDSRPRARNNDWNNIHLPASPRNDNRQGDQQRWSETPNDEFSSPRRRQGSANDSSTASPVPAKNSLPSSEKNTVRSPKVSLSTFRLAVLKGNLSEVELCLKEAGSAKGLINEVLDDDGFTALMVACATANYDMIKLLLDKGADVNKGKSKFTPLMAVCNKQTVDSNVARCVQLLISNGANVNAQEAHLSTVLMYAVRSGQEEAVDVLMKAGADINMTDNQGKTALMWAAENKRGRIVRKLLTAGANVDVMCLKGLTAKDIANSAGFSELLEIFEGCTTAKCECSPELQQVLAGVSMQKYVTEFEKHNVLTLPMFLSLGKEDFKEMNITSVGDVQTLMDIINNMIREPWKKDVIPAVYEKPGELSAADVIAVMNNANEVLAHLWSTVMFIRVSVKERPSLLERNSDMVELTGKEGSVKGNPPSGRPKSIADLANRAAGNAGKFIKEAAVLAEHLKTLDANVELISVDALVPKEKKSSRVKYLIPVGIVAAVAYGAYFHRDAMHTGVNVVQEKIAILLKK